MVGNWKSHKSNHEQLNFWEVRKKGDLKLERVQNQEARVGLNSTSRMKEELHK